MSRPAALRKPSAVDVKNPARELPQVFFRLLMRHRAWVKSTVMRFGLSAFQAMPLVLMDPSRPATMSEVAAIVGCGPSNLTGIVDKLEARGLVRRRAVPGDRRVKEVSLTRAGIAFRKRLLARVREPAPWMLALSPGDQRQLIEILRRALASAPAPEGAPAAARELLEPDS